MREFTCQVTPSEYWHLLKYSDLSGLQDGDVIRQAIRKLSIPEVLAPIECRELPEQNTGSITPITIAIDFDGTCVKHEFPKIGHSIGAEPVLKDLVAVGHRLILFTMRSDIATPQPEDKAITPKGGNYLSEAIQWFKEREIPLYGVNTNPTQNTWTHSPKAYAHLYIDDAALGIPLLQDNPNERPFVDWIKVRDMLVQRGLL